MKTHEQFVSRAFNKAAATYDEHARIQTTAGRILIAELVRIKSSFQHVMDAGCGTGTTTRTLASATNAQTILAIDIAASLLARAPASSQIHYQQQNFNEHFSGKFDLIFSNMSLHWSPSLRQTLETLHAQLEADGLLAFTIPLQGTFMELAGYFAAQDCLPLTEAAAALEASGYRILFANQLLLRESFPDARAALRSIKLTGATHVRSPSQKSLRGKSILQQLPFNQLSYVIGFFIAEKLA